MNNENKNLINICPIIDGTCDLTCEFKAHGLLKRAIPVPHEHIVVKCDSCLKVIAKCKCLGEAIPEFKYQTCNDCFIKENE